MKNSTKSKEVSELKDSLQRSENVFTRELTLHEEFAIVNAFSKMLPEHCETIRMMSNDFKPSNFALEIFEQLQNHGELNQLDLFSIADAGFSYEDETILDLHAQICGVIEDELQHRNPLEFFADISANDLIAYRLNDAIEEAISVVTQELREFFASPDFFRNLSEYI